MRDLWRFVMAAGEGEERAEACQCGEQTKAYLESDKYRGLCTTLFAV